ncbi:hypothetical protein AAMO2058_001412700 [Amorphochlora amoebiformis]
MREEFRIEGEVGTLTEEEYDDEELQPLDFDLEPIEGEVPLLKRVQIVLARLKSTSICFAIYVVIALLCGFIFCSFVFGPPSMRSSTAFLVLEAIINVLLVGEVGSDIVIQGRFYWSRMGNVIDFVVTLACMTFFFAFLEEEQQNADEESLPLNAVLLGIRYFLQLLRMMLCAFRGHNTMRVLSQDEVAVHELELESMVRVTYEGEDDRNHSLDEKDGLTSTLVDTMNFKKGIERMTDA